MKAVAIALVLIAGAAVVLWYGNTLNSWVLGGLIGGLAALLLSIPISLLLFSYLSKRHEERLQEEEQEEVTLARENEYRQVPSRIARRPREVEGYVVTDETPEEEIWQEEQRYIPRPSRALPAPSQTRQENPYQSQGNRNPDRLPAPQQGTYIPPQRTQQAQPGGKETTVLRSTTKKIGATGRETSALSHHRSEALRTARLEAAKQRQDDDVEVLPTNNPKRGVSVRPNQALAKQEQTSIRAPRPRHVPSQQPQQRPARRVVDSSPSQQGERRASQYEHEYTERPQRREPHTDYISEQSPRTEPVRLSRQEQLDRLARDRNLRPTTDEISGDIAGDTTGDINRPLLRRAPYMYEDDPLRQKLAEQIDTPSVRRSSRHNEDNDE